MVLSCHLYSWWSTIYPRIYAIRDLIGVCGVVLSHSFYDHLIITIKAKMPNTICAHIINAGSRNHSSMYAISCILLWLYIFEYVSDRERASNILIYFCFIFPIKVLKRKYSSCSSWFFKVYLIRMLDHFLCLLNRVSKLMIYLSIFCSIAVIYKSSPWSVKS